jgi:hypothetical protein
MPFYSTGFWLLVGDRSLVDSRWSLATLGLRFANEAGLKAGPAEMQMDEQTRKLVAEALLAAMK